MEKKSKRKTLKYILLFLLIIVIVFIALTIRKMIIISNLQNKISQYIGHTNYYAKLISYHGGIVVRDSYVKEDLYIASTSAITDNDTRKLIEYSDGTKTNRYIETNEAKIALLNSEGITSKIEVLNYLYTENLGQLFLMSMMSSIKSEKANGKDCYYINNTWSSSVLLGEGRNAIYIDKDTGLPVRAYNGTLVNNERQEFDIVVDYEYRFNVVTEQDIKEPDITEYRIVEE